ncbi:MAG: hypothetical protein ACI934_001089, partial [Pseudohongiellaceae bacterium]
EATFSPFFLYCFRQFTRLKYFEKFSHSQICELDQIMSLECPLG